MKAIHSGVMIKAISGVMQRFAFVVIPLLFIGCHQPVRINGRTLADTLEILKKKADFRPLDFVEAYKFFTKYYLPHLDSIPTKRRVFIYPAKGRDFAEIYKTDEAKLLKLYNGDIRLDTPQVNFEPPFIFDTTSTWNNKILKNAVIITDELTVKLIKNPTAFVDSTMRANWFKRYGIGYMCVSYPQYNANTKILIMREWLENYDWCGTGKERVFHYKKTALGWEAY